MIMEAEKPHDLLDTQESCRWPENQQCWGHERINVLAQPVSQRGCESNLPPLFHSSRALDGLDDPCSPLGRAICFTIANNSNVNLFQKHTQASCFIRYLGISWHSGPNFYVFCGPSWHIKLTMAVYIPFLHGSTTVAFLHLFVWLFE